jgi:chemotaxis signal transduction protein
LRNPNRVKKLGPNLAEATALHIVIIVSMASRLAGLLADRVFDIVSLDASQIQSAPRIANANRINFQSGLATIEGAMIALIDLQNLLREFGKLSD